MRLRSATTGLPGGNCRRRPAAGHSRRRPCWQRSDRTWNAFGSARRLPSWAGVCPSNRESAGERGSGWTRTGDRYVRSVLCEIAHAASRTRNAQFGPLKKGLTVRRDAGRAGAPVAHKILRIICAVPLDGAPYVDPEVDYNTWSRSATARAGLLEQALRLAHRERTREGLPAPATAAKGPSAIARGLRRAAPGSSSVQRRITRGVSGARLGFQRNSLTMVAVVPRRMSSSLSALNTTQAGERQSISRNSNATTRHVQV